GNKFLVSCRLFCVGQRASNPDIAFSQVKSLRAGHGIVQRHRHSVMNHLGAKLASVSRCSIRPHHQPVLTMRRKYSSPHWLLRTLALATAVSFGCLLFGAIWLISLSNTLAADPSVPANVDSHLQ